MGRDKPKKFSKMGYFEKEAYKDEMAKKYGIQGTEYRDGRGNTQYRRNDKALKSAMRNDYDYRTSAQHMDGVKGNGKFGDFTDYERSAVKLHREAGNGGSYSSNKDITGVTNNLVKDDRRSLQDQLDGMASTSDLNALKEKMMAQATSKAARPIEPSDRMAAAEDRLKGAAYNTPPGLHSKNNANPSKADDQTDAARSFLDGYKFDVTKGAGLKHDIETSVSNAARHVTDVYGR